jgi:hypothetical protein
MSFQRRNFISWNNTNRWFSCRWSVLLRRDGRWNKGASMPVKLWSVDLGHMSRVCSKDPSVPLQSWGSLPCWLSEQHNPKQGFQSREKVLNKGVQVSLSLPFVGRIWAMGSHPNDSPWGVSVLWRISDCCVSFRRLGSPACHAQSIFERIYYGQTRERERERIDQYEYEYEDGSKDSLDAE